MILVVGAMASGKRSYVKSLGYEDADIADGILDEQPVLDNLENLVYRFPENAVEMLPALLSKDVIICQEIGSGIIPVDFDQVAIRRITGKLCILLAKQATQVVRLVCGVPTVIKDTN
ncbi:MAG: hypothetical protein RR387_01685 [Clostridiales bacterium]